MDERLAEHLKLLCKYLGYLDTLAQNPKEKIINDITLRGAVERYLQLAIESCLNVGGRILAIQVNDPEIGAPENYADIFVKLGKLNVYSDEDALNLVNMARFRNKLVHGYWEIDPKMIFEILHDSLKDIKRYMDNVTTYLNRQQ
jgi:uncharacterized protein YutE (UPF0331/DUF86 family)